MNLIDFEDGTFTFTKSLSAEEVRKIKDNVSNDNVTINYRDIAGLNVYRTSAGVMAIFEDVLNLSFDSLIDLNKAIDDGFYTKVVGREMMYKKNMYGKNFPSQTLTLINLLLKELEINENHSLDFDLLELTEKKIYSLPKPYHFYRGHFIQIIALLGEVIRKKHPTLQWHMELAKDKQTWNPFLLGLKQKYAFFSDLYEELFINDNVEKALTLVCQIYE